MQPLTPDANTEAASSTASDVKGTDSSFVEQVENQVDETVVKTVEDELSEATTDETGETTSEEKTETEVLEEAPVNLDKQDDAKLPFHKHERFIELVGEKNRYKQEAESVKPLAEQARVTNDFMREHQIPPQEYQNALQYLMLLRKDPAQAYAMLKPTFEHLALLAGDRLPPDLQTEVAAGTLAPERASEIARARAQQTYSQWRGQHNQQSQQQTQAEQVGTTIQTWVSTKQSVDPDFKPGTPLWEQVDLRIKGMPPFRNAQEAQAGSETAYKEAKAFITKYTPRAVQPVKRPPVSRNTASNNSTIVKTPEDVMRAIANGVKPSQMKYA